MAASEVAIFSLSRFQIRVLKERFETTYRLVKKLLMDPGGLLASISVANEVINIAISTLIAKNVAEMVGQGSWAEIQWGIPSWMIHSAVGAVLTAPLLLVVCEISPKAIGARANQAIATLTVRPLHFVYLLLSPVRWIAKAGIALVSSQPLTEVKKLREEEFIVLVEEGHKDGSIHESELDLIKNVFELDDRPASEIMTPIQKTFTLGSDLTIRKALEVTRSVPFSRIPLYSTHKNQVLGILYKKDLILSKLNPASLDAPVTTLMGKPQIVSAAAKLSSVFRKLKQSRNHIAVIQNQSGQAIGIITMSDVLDEIFEDLTKEAEA